MSEPRIPKFKAIVEYEYGHGGWVHGYLRMRLGSPLIIELKNEGEFWYEREYEYPVDYWTICESTGRRDENGKEIYKDDVVRDVETEKEYIVVYDEDRCAFMLKDMDTGKRRFFKPSMKLKVEYNLNDVLVEEVLEDGENQE